LTLSTDVPDYLSILHVHVCVCVCVRERARASAKELIGTFVCACVYV
jgi:hypothetical protein